MEMRRRRAYVAPAVGGDGVTAAVAADGDAPADAAAADGQAAAAAGAVVEQKASEELAVIGQEAIKDCGKLQNTPWNDPNDESGKKVDLEDKERRVDRKFAKWATSCFGRQVTLGPLFSPEQVAQANDPRNMSSMLPFQRDLQPSADPGRLSFFRGLLPGFEHLQGLQQQRQREYERRLQMESMVEQLGLQLRASQNENQRLREELVDAKRDSSRYGTPGEKSIQEVWDVPKSVLMKSEKEDGVGGRGSSPPASSSFRSCGLSWKKPEARQLEPESELFEENDPGQEDGAEAQQGPYRPSAGGLTIQILLKVVETMQAMQKSMLRSKENLGDEVEDQEFKRMGHRLIQIAKKLKQEKKVDQEIRTIRKKEELVKKKDDAGSSHGSIFRRMNAQTNL
eukprot:s1761_g7.t1